jgi:hypothetical protein
MRAVIDALQALRGIALIAAVTIVAEVGVFSRFPLDRIGAWVARDTGPQPKRDVTPATAGDGCGAERIRE